MSFLAQVTYTGNGSTTQYSITFPFLDSSHVKAFINGVETTAFTISSSTLTFNSAPANSSVVRIERQTPISSRIVDFTDGSVLTESDLDKSADQNFFVAQEITDDSQSTMKIATDDKFDAQNKVIKNVANPVNPQDAVTKHYLENTWLSPTDKTNLTTVAGISSNVTTVAGNTTNVNTVAGNNSNITTVATNIANINTVATDIAKVITVANDLNETVSEIETVASDLQEAQPEIDTVAGSIANVNTVGTGIANVNTVASSISNVNATAGAITNINTVGGIASDVTTVAGIAGDITSLANSLEKTYVVTVANVGGTNVFVLDGTNNPTIEVIRGNKYIFDVSDSSVSGHPLAFKDGSGNSWTTGVTVTGTAGQSGAKVTFEVPSTAPNSMRYYCTSHGNAMGNTITVSDSAINTVASNIANVNSIASNLTNINAVNSNSSNINAVVSNATNINTVASNLSGVNSFAERYRVGSSNPSSSNDEGDLFYNSTDNRLKFFNGTSFVNIESLTETDPTAIPFSIALG